MRFDVRAFGIAAGVVAGSLFTLCTLLVVVSPHTAAVALGHLTHVAVSDFTSPTLGSYLIGAFCWAVGTGLTFGAAAGIYTRLAANSTPQVVSQRHAAVPV